MLLTVHFVDTSLMLAYIRDANAAETVTDAFRELRKKLGNSLYKSLFPVILTMPKNLFPLAVCYI